MRCERGQGTIEWIGLVVLVALALGGVATAARRAAPAPPSLGGMLAKRIAGVGSLATAGEAPAFLVAVPPARVPGGKPGAKPRGAKPPAASPPPRPLPPRAVPLPGGLRSRVPFALRFPRVPFPRIPVGDGFRWLQGAVGKGVNRVWIGCLGHRRFRNAVKHPHPWFRPMSTGDGLRAFNECLNPVEFLGNP